MRSLWPAAMPGQRGLAGADDVPPGADQVRQVPQRRQRNHAVRVVGEDGLARRGQRAGQHPVVRSVLPRRVAPGLVVFGRRVSRQRLGSELPRRANRAARRVQGAAAIFSRSGGNRTVSLASAAMSRMPSTMSSRSRPSGTVMGVSGSTGMNSATRAAPTDTREARALDLGTRVSGHHVARHAADHHLGRPRLRQRVEQLELDGQLLGMRPHDAICAFTPRRTPR